MNTRIFTMDGFPVLGRFITAFALLVTAAGLPARAAAPRAETPPIAAPRGIGVTKGVFAIAGDRGAERALGLARETELLIYLQLENAEEVEAARQAVDAAGYLNTRIYVERGPYSHLHLADNVADALVAIGEAGRMPRAEALRVIHPQAKALLGDAELIKPFPEGIDDWSHPYHGPDNNPLSNDRVAVAPYLTQFLADPRYAPLPQCAVASGGRIFKAFGHIAFKTREEPWLNTLAAFNGYNGTLLWRREIAPALMVHRNTLIATPTRLYFGDDKSCKVFDPATGHLLEEIAPPADQVGGTFWKWMALDDGVLYALIGDQEERDPVIRAKSTNHGWPWYPLSPGFNREEHIWGFGRTLLAIDPPSKRILWRHQEAEPIDGRAVCLKNGRLYAFRFGAYLTCLDARTGKEVWRQSPESAPGFFKTLGEYSKRQDWRTNWRTVAYLKAGDQALYFAGPMVNKLVAVSTADGRVLWEHPYDNYQIILRDDGIYGVGGQIDKDPARKFDPLTGRVLEEYPVARRACTRVNGAVDAIFCRANGGSTRFDLATGQPELVSPMRPNCHDGVTIANGLLYWWPSVCDCNLTLYGITSLAPAGDFQFSADAVESERLQTFTKADEAIKPLSPMPGDWPQFRGDQHGTVTSPVRIPTRVHRLWEFESPTSFTPTAPTAVDGLVFFAGTDGAVRALSSASGQLAWKATTGGDVRYPPTIWAGRALVGSGDGFAYSFEAATGRPLWRFQAAPVERKIPVYGTLQSTWPVGTGVTVADGVAYLAAGIVNYDGTHVYALEAATGALKWQNNTSGHLDPEAHSGVSVQGFMAVSDGRLYLPGGNAVSPAMFDLRNGRCLNDPAQLKRKVNNNVIGSFAPRGSELYFLGDQVRVAGKPHYAHPEYQVYDGEVLNKTLLAKSGSSAVAWINNARLSGFAEDTPDLERKLLAAWGRPRIQEVKPRWEIPCPGSLALAVGDNACVVARPTEIAAYDLGTGTRLWTHPLTAAPVPWGLCLDRGGHIIVTLTNGHVICLAAAEMAIAPDRDEADSRPLLRGEGERLTR